ncbi:NAD(P)-dependent dehydrogenase (short-subunit alcohol dehydrogenase family) [Saccharothrix carnea]|uniref:NAD(P)-dependent dehydrogenase (Short-subunit alcohol dehydrogenase family) n=1 Tax=Saccharothrix carnea TaxID=1280637 RepID=A0A2P8I2G4_SACCR|nr:oxidoreductase [Saccharothrix carnea]PSL52653.1 NAD(P)-dependent dehydrogenase (short-subunit alcohol dehydrogenase family) [Saccharothrix carnea]
MTKWNADHIPDQRGRVAVVTGANSGLGLATATELARHGARVVLAVRDPDAGARAAAAIRTSVAGAGLDVRRLDLASLASVRAFADALLADVPSIDLLVNNAGAVLLGPPRTTADGFELHLGTNALGHFALTGLLLDALGRAEAARVISLSSITHKNAHLDFDDLMSERDFDAARAYGRAKLATTVLGLELDRRLRATGSPIVSALAHPGVTNTNLTSRAWQDRGRLARTIIPRLFVAVTQPVSRGVLPQLHAATAPDVRGGRFFGPAGPWEMRGHVTEVRPSREAADPSVGRRLWAEAEELTGVSYL